VSEIDHEAEAMRLKAAIGAIHNLLHANKVNEAHEACECAIAGQQVKQPNLTLPDTVRVQVFASDFIQLCLKHEVEAGFLLLMNSATIPGAVSMQCGGAVRPAKLIERGMGRQHRSTYQGEHGG